MRPDKLLTSYQRETIETSEKQLSLPFVGDPPRVLTMGPLPMAQMILYRPDLMAGCIIKAEDVTGSLGFNQYHVVAPDKEQSSKIANYLAGREK